MLMMVTIIMFGFLVPARKPRVSCMLDKDPTTEQHPSPTVSLLNQLSITDETGKTDKLSRVSLRPDILSGHSCVAAA